MMAGRRTYLEPVLSAVRARGVDIPLELLLLRLQRQSQPAVGRRHLYREYVTGARTIYKWEDLEDEDESFADLRWGNRAVTRALDAGVLHRTLFGHFMAAGSSYERHPLV